MTKFSTQNPHRTTVWREGNATCPICGCAISWDNHEMHHIFEKGLFPREIIDVPELYISLCRHCHQEYHNDPTKEARANMLKLKLGIMQTSGKAKEWLSEIRVIIGLLPNAHLVPKYEEIEKWMHG